MKVEQARVVLRARSMSEVIDLSLRFIVGLQPGLYLRLAIVTLLPAQTVCVTAWAAGWGWEWIWLLAVGLGTVAQGVFTVAAGRLMFAEQLSAQTVLRQFAGRLPAYLTTLLSSRLLMALAAVVVILFPIAWIRLALVHEVTLLENASAGQAQRRASRMARHGSSRAALLPIAVVGLTAGCILTAEVLGQALVEFVLQLGRPIGALWDSGGSLYAVAGYFASIPLVATARFLAYVDGRTRRDGWDVQVRLMNVRAEAMRRAA